ncbi:FHA domain-containing protein [Occultella gossypii]|uniref:FHA domain-containing protein n=1 Tax=Occultella gossypii TaxID=2800820 RepID=A0ABS7S334_9MICO|nr:FHA domain-containing protein [Occultella gossypii]MBZ2194720.1 FHA domain-containing protein [Occultella gossypii]
MNFDDVPARVHPGRHHLVRLPGVVAIIRTDPGTDPDAARDLLERIQTSSRTAPTAPGRDLARQLSIWLSRFEETNGVAPGFGAISASENGVAIFLYGDISVTERVDDAELPPEDRVSLFGKDAAFTVDRLLPWPAGALQLIADDDADGELDIPEHAADVLASADGPMPAWAGFHRGVTPGGGLLFGPVTDHMSEPVVADVPAASGSHLAGPEVPVPSGPGSHGPVPGSSATLSSAAYDAEAMSDGEAMVAEPGSGERVAEDEPMVGGDAADGAPASAEPMAEAAGTSVPPPPAPSGAQVPPSPAGSAVPAPPSQRSVVPPPPSAGTPVVPPAPSAGTPVVPPAPSASPVPPPPSGAPVVPPPPSGAPVVPPPPSAGTPAAALAPPRLSELIQDGPAEPPRAPLPPAAPAPRQTAQQKAAEKAAGVKERPQDYVQGFRCSRKHLNDPRVSFCRVCGIRMDQMTGVLVEERRPPLGLLVLDVGATFVLDDNYVLGRNPESDAAVREGTLRPVRLDDTSGALSRVHAEIRLSGWDVVLIDRGSANGTYVAATDEQSWQRLAPNQHFVLTPGTHVRVGQRTFTFESSAARLR